MQVRVRPSKLKQASLCPGSLQFESLLEENGNIIIEDEEIAAKGTLMHQCIAAMIHGYVVDDGKVNWSFEQLSHMWQTENQELNGYDCWCIFSSYLWLMDVIKEYDIEPVNILIEQHMDGADLGMARGGTADVILVIPFKQLIIIDWKFGYLQQDEADISDQLAGYAVMGGRTFKTDDVVVMIYQARMEEPLSSAWYDADLLKQSEQWVRETCAAAQAEDAELHYNYKACYYCDALGRCPEARTTIMNIMDAYNTVANESELDVVEAYKAMKIAVRAETKLKSYIKPQLEADPTLFPGLSLKDGNKRTTVGDPESLFMSMSSEGMNFWEIADVSIGKLKKMVPKDSGLLNYIIDDGRNAPSLVVD